MELMQLTTTFIFTTAPFDSCHASTLVELSDASLLAAWFGGSREGAKDVAIWMSRYRDGQWSPPEVVAREADVPCWNPVLFREAESPQPVQEGIPAPSMPSGKIWLFYKFGPSPLTWTGAYKTSNDEGKTWSAPTYLPAGLLGPTKNKPIQLSNGDIVCGTSVESHKAWSCWVEIICEGGKSWTKHGPIVFPGENYGIIQPTIFELGDGRLKMLTRSTERIGAICESVSDDGGRTWRSARKTQLPNPNSALDAVRLKNGAVMLVYNHTTKGRTPLSIAFSDDGGETWAYRQDIETEPGEFSYPSVIQTQDGNIHITYTWKRQRIKHVVIHTKHGNAEKLPLQSKCPSFPIKPQRR